MITKPALPAKADALTCAACGLRSRPPIVLLVGTAGRCANRTACEHRVRRAANARKRSTPAGAP